MSGKTAKQNRKNNHSKGQPSSVVLNPIFAGTLARSLRKFAATLDDEITIWEDFRVSESEEDMKILGSATLSDFAAHRFNVEVVIPSGINVIRSVGHLAWCECGGEGHSYRSSFRAYLLELATLAETLAGCDAIQFQGSRGTATVKWSRFHTNLTIHAGTLDINQEQADVA